MRAACLKERLAAIETRRFIPQEQRVTIDHLLDAVETHLETRGAKALPAFVSHLKPVRAFFAATRAHRRDQRGRRALRSSPGSRRAEPGPPSTEKSGGLKQAFNLALRQARLIRAPYIALLREDNARQGFFRARGVRHGRHAAAPPPIADAARFAYLSGWRRGEILGLRWDAVDRKAREIRFAYVEEWAGPGPTARGRPVGPDRATLGGTSHNRAWRCHPAGRVCVPPGGPPDRRLQESVESRVPPGRPSPASCFMIFVARRFRNMVRAGVPQAVAMSISGHRTISMFLRYNITSHDDQRDALRKNPGACRRAPSPADHREDRRREPSGVSTLTEQWWVRFSPAPMMCEGGR